MKPILLFLRKHALLIVLALIVGHQQVLLTEIRHKAGYLFLVSDLHNMRLSEINDRTSAMSDQLDQIEIELRHH